MVVDRPWNHERRGDILEYMDGHMAGFLNTSSHNHHRRIASRLGM
jgi:hypothetical protein